MQHHVSGNRYRFCYRGESWWDALSVQPLARKPLDRLVDRLNKLEKNQPGRWWTVPIDWTVPEMGFGDPVTSRHQAVRFDPLTAQDPPSSLSLEVVVEELRYALSEFASRKPLATTVEQLGE